LVAARRVINAIDYCLSTSVYEGVLTVDFYYTLPRWTVAADNREPREIEHIENIVQVEVP
jgi:hypothetical protein